MNMVVQTYCVMFMLSIVPRAIPLSLAYMQIIHDVNENDAQMIESRDGPDMMQRAMQAGNHLETRLDIGIPVNEDEATSG